jgi:hypothetical protein
MPEQIGCPDIRPLGPTVAQLVKAPKVTQATLAGYLAIVMSDYEAFGRVRDEYQGARNIPIPVEVIALIGEKLVGKARWSKEERDARTATAHKQRVKWQGRPMSFGGRTRSSRGSPSRGSLRPTSGITFAS